jgi:hypothetical protein
MPIGRTGGRLFGARHHGRASSPGYAGAPAESSSYSG